MTLARQKHTPRERQIAKALGLTDAQLDALLRIKAGYWPGNAAAALEAKGLAFREYDPTPTRAFNRPIERSGLTEAGAALLRRARHMGF